MSGVGVLTLGCVLALGAVAGAAAETPAGAATASTQASVNEATVARLRAEADAASGPEAGAADLRHAVALLEQALALLDAGKPQLNGSSRQRWDTIAVRWVLALIQSRLGNKEQALLHLDAAHRLAWLPQLATDYGQDADFAPLRSDPRFQTLLQLGAAAQRLQGNTALATPYREKLTVEERVAGLSLYWAEVRQGFAHFANAPELDWNGVYMDYLSKAIAADNTRDYYRVLMQLAPLLRDGHTTITPPSQLWEEFFSRPPLRAIALEGKILVQAVDSLSLARRVAVGEEIVAIDGVPVVRYATERIAPFISSSTPQWLRQMVAHNLFNGQAKVPLTLRLRKADGSERNEVLARSGYTDVATDAVPFKFTMLAGDVAYLALDSFSGEASLHAFEQALPTILRAKALVIDVRRNTGGSGLQALQVLSYLSKLPIPTAQSFVRNDELLLRSAGLNLLNWTQVDGTGHFTQERAQVFEGKVAVLASATTFSAAEDFLSSFRAMKRGVIVGETSGGSTGASLAFPLPGGGEGRVCIKLDRQPDGADIVGHGIVPDIAVPATVADFRQGRDAALERALKELSPAGKRRN